MEIEKLIRKNIWELQPYSCAREEYEGGHLFYSMRMKILSIRE